MPQQRYPAGYFGSQGKATPTKGRAKRRPTPVKDEPTSQSVGAVSLWFAIRAASELNRREHWTKRDARRTLQQTIVSLKFRDFRLAEKLVKRPWRITISRVGPRLMDSDNNAASLKHVQDQVARELGIDDGDRTEATWDYRQLKQPFYAVRVHVAERKGSDGAEGQ
jgi:hypothetical protein